MTGAELTAVFGWMTLINVVIYLISALVVLVARDGVVHMQSRMMGVPEADWPRIYTEYLGHFKLLIIVFNIAPYLALRMVF